MQFIPLDTDYVRQIRAGAPDANGQPAERGLSDGPGYPCRHCLKNIPAGAPIFVFAARPFPDLQPYAETGPIYICADDCAQFSGDDLPPILTSSPDYLLKGYSHDNRIVYGTGQITPHAQIKDYCLEVFTDPSVAYIHARSARNNCYQLKIARAPEET